MVGKPYTNITITFFVVVMFFSFLTACSGGKKQLANAITERDSLPSLDTKIITSLISDSGIIRYRIKTPEWLVYDKKNPSYWAFEKGLYLERFDSLLHVEATVKCDTAYYYDGEELWKLMGHVLVKNIQGEKFQTELLYWNQQTEKVYSDEFIRIEQPDRIITGHGFDANQTMTVYNIHKPEGIFYVDKEALDVQPTDSVEAEKNK